MFLLLYPIMTISQRYYQKLRLGQPSVLLGIVTEYFTSEILHQDSILDILEIIKEIGNKLLWCTEHNHALTTNDVKSYLLYRLHFYTIKKNEIFEIR